MKVKEQLKDILDKRRAKSAAMRYLLQPYVTILLIEVDLLACKGMLSVEVAFVALQTIELVARHSVTWLEKWTRSNSNFAVVVCHACALPRQVAFPHTKSAN